MQIPLLHLQVSHQAYIYIYILTIGFTWSTWTVWHENDSELTLQMSLTYSSCNMLLEFPKPLHLFPFLLWPGPTFAVKSLLHALEMESIMEMVLIIPNEFVPIWFRNKYHLLNNIIPAGTLWPYLSVYANATVIFLWIPCQLCRRWDAN